MSKTKKVSKTPKMIEDTRLPFSDKVAAHLLLSLCGIMLAYGGYYLALSNRFLIAAMSSAVVFCMMRFVVRSIKQ